MPFLAPYFLRGFGEDSGVRLRSGAPDDPGFDSGAVAVLLSSAEVYGDEYVRAAEDDAADSAALRREKALVAAAEAAGAGRIIVLRTAPVVATAMTGYPRRLAEAVHGGRYLPAEGSAGRRSVVHGTELVRAARLLVDSGEACGVYNVSDGADPSVDELAEALAARMNAKRIFRIKDSWARLLLGRRRLRRRGLERTLSIARLCAAVDYHPQATTDYLRTHVYDESSL